jgi:hypothetical protein
VDDYDVAVGKDRYIVATDDYVAFASSLLVTAGILRTLAFRAAANIPAVLSEFGHVRCRLMPAGAFLKPSICLVECHLVSLSFLANVPLSAVLAFVNHILRVWMQTL